MHHREESSYAISSQSSVFHSAVHLISAQPTEPHAVCRDPIAIVGTAESDRSQLGATAPAARSAADEKSATASRRAAVPCRTNP